ncbi:amidohydrolase/deacetylase family metallohydrolase [Saccharibacillus sp. JS10]|uniref:amidohydrolase/deacetylase family metallohydrolase n=1 Tax=Saccharibacillus sp. JS10 TaxID=2950552 RepID=UPI00210A1895|nr:amidohydrolase/deacetylase family metallohydrolase [Saccharibacillus sp. JS10]MCQ4088903.1 amidohydrolase/deacetylase family metallohydrolase [Saccharibacillus sp. JS10]
MKPSMVLSRVRFLNGEIVDIAMENGRITGLHEPGTVSGTQTINGEGLYVSSGWIDMHVHAFPAFDPYGDEIDAIGIQGGCTTIVDAGSCGADRIHELAASRKQSHTRLFAFLNISRIGLERTDELSQLHWIDETAVMQALENHADFIIGLKARISSSVVGENGITPLRRAIQFAEDTGLPIMTHIGSAPPLIEEIMPLLRSRDMVTHYLNGKANNLFDEKGLPKSVLTDAIERGVKLDVGHGTASFSFETAQQAKDAGISLHTISTDIYRGNRLNGPVYNMANVLTKFLTLGYTLTEVIEAVTTAPAAWLDRPELGRIQVGDAANLTLFSIEPRPSRLIDSEGRTYTSTHTIQAEGVILNDQYFTCPIRA